ncbi:zinc knuckle CX2CX4HX4C containing protein, partial [Tanacetum coccineum]
MGGSPWGRKLNTWFAEVLQKNIVKDVDRVALLRASFDGMNMGWNGSFMYRGMDSGDDPLKGSLRASMIKNIEGKMIGKDGKPLRRRPNVKISGDGVIWSRLIGARVNYYHVRQLRIRKIMLRKTWAKFGLKRVMLEDDFFLFQFESKDGMEKVMEGGPWLIRLVPLFLNIWTPNTLLMKEEIKSAPVWIKLHHVPIVAYSEVGLSLITTQIGRPIMLDTYTSSMCLKSWGRKEYARALVEVLAEEELLESMVVAIPKNDGKGYTLATISIEYEWKPPRCGVCKVFDHVEDKCPKVVKPVVVVESTKNDDDGFTEVKKKKHKPKQPRQVEGVRLSKPKPNFYYRRVEKGETSIANGAKDDKKKKEP